MESIERGVALAISTLEAERVARPDSGASRPRFVIRHTPRDITSAVEAATRLRDDPTVVGVVGDAESGRTLDALPVYEDLEHNGEHAVVAVSPTATSPALSGASPWLFRVTPHDVSASQTVAVYAADSLGARRAAIIYRNDSYGRDWAAAFTKAFAARGGAVVQRDPYVAGVTEWAAYAAYVRAQRADVVLFPGSHEHAAELLRAMRAEGLRVPLIGGDAVAGIAGQPEFAGARYTVPFIAGRATSFAASQFVTAYRTRWRTDPDARAALAYDAALAIGRAVLVVGPDRWRVREHLNDLGTKVPAISGVAGPIAFDGKHDVVGRSMIVATVGGAWAGADDVAAARDAAARAGRTLAAAPSARRAGARP
jgi:branched-chain amino acid transport system substrate-binding protein